MHLQKNIILIGDYNTGKTLLYNRLSSVFSEKSDLEIKDTNSLERYNKSLPKSYYKNANIVLLVYRTDQINTYENLIIWYFNLCQELDITKLKIFLIGNIVSSNTQTNQIPIKDYFSYDYHILLNFINGDLTLLVKQLFDEISILNSTTHEVKDCKRIILDMEYDENLNYKIGGPCCAGAYRESVIGKRKKNGKLEEYMRY